MFSHIFVGSNDLEKSKQFYDALFAALGGNPGFFDPMGRLIYMHNGGMFMATKPINGQPAVPANGGTIGFAMSGPEQTDAWHAAGVAAGGCTCEDPPGVRSSDFGDLYLAYLRDPDGNKLCGLYAMPKES
jgi:catechol 2,3-dioxygenase-like lactoylglutathione lyase family enzyme